MERTCISCSIILFLRIWFSHSLIFFSILLPFISNVQLLLRKKAAEELKKEQERKAAERRRIIEERCGKPKEVESASEGNEVRCDFYLCYIFFLLLCFRLIQFFLLHLMPSNTHIVFKKIIFQTSQWKRKDSQSGLIKLKYFP